LSGVEESWSAFSDFDQKRVLLQNPSVVKSIGANIFMKWATREIGQPSLAQSVWHLGANWNPDQAHVEDANPDSLDRWRSDSSLRVRECTDALAAYTEWGHNFQDPLLFETYTSVTAENERWRSLMKPIPAKDVLPDLSRHCYDSDPNVFEDNEEVRAALAKVDKGHVWSLWFDDQLQLVPEFLRAECNGYLVTEAPASEWGEWLVLAPLVICPFCEGDSFTTDDVECPICGGRGESVLYGDRF
jgi:hypothetical protein